MKERPILFNGEMVQAILEGRKTQTRRTQGLDVLNSIPTYWYYDGLDDNGNYLAWNVWAECSKILKCPYGQIGDRLWVRETWQLLIAQTVSWGPGEDDWDFDAEESDSIPKMEPLSGTICYRADDLDSCKWWRPSIFMPHWASRLTLEITNIHIERLQDITDTGSMYEGWKCDPSNLDYLPQMWYRDLWDHINAKRGHPWTSNPWVWVIEFRRIQP